jgi:hypothetical protein
VLEPVDPAEGGEREVVGSVRGQTACYMRVSKHRLADGERTMWERRTVKALETNRPRSAFEQRYVRKVWIVD